MMSYTIQNAITSFCILDIIRSPKKHNEPFPETGNETPFCGPGPLYNAFSYLWLSLTKLFLVLFKYLYDDKAC